MRVSSGQTLAWRTPPWPFSQVPTVESQVIGQRFFPNFPLVQDPIAQALAVVCDHGCEEVNGPAPVFGATLDKQLDALRCDYVFTEPDQHPERIEWRESVRRVSLTTNVLAAGPLAWEMARLDSPESGIVRVETIDTWFRATINGATIELSAVPNTPNGNGSPFAALAFGTFSVVLRWSLIHTRFGWVGPAPLWLTAAPPSMIPRGHDLLAPWTDNRYAWGSPRQRHAHYLSGQHGLVRLFVEVQGVGAFPSLPPTIELAGSLTGFQQSAGRDAAAVRNASLRI